MYSDFEFLEESFLIDDLVQLEFGLSRRASIFEDLNLDSVGTALKNFAHEHLKNSDEVPGGYFTSVLNIMAPAVLTRVHPIIGLLYLIADHYGFGFSDMIEKVVTALKPKIQSGEGISPGEVSDIGKSALGISAEASFVDLLNSIKKEAKLLHLEKIARKPSLDFSSFKDALLGNSNYSAIPTDIPFLFGDGKASILQRVFGSLFSKPVGGRTVKWLLGGFAIWIVKTVLAGAGLLMLSEGAASLLHHPKHEDIKNIEPASIPQENHSTSPSEIAHNSLPSQITSPALKQSDKVWIVPLVGDGSVADTLKIWTLDLYPELKQYHDINSIIMNDLGFQSMVDALSKPANLGKANLVMPNQFSNRKQVVDQFINSIKGNLK
jgi:hypothetical protein